MGCIAEIVSWRTRLFAPDRATLERIVERHPKIGSLVRDVRAKWPRQLGTLGGGNHFIEVCLDEADRVWVMLHSGSRGTGNALGRYFIGLAKRDMERHLARLPAKDLAYLEEGSDHFDDYAGAVRWAQRYALENRRLMMGRILTALGARLPPFRVEGTAVECHHNYVAEERHFGEAVYVTRKGAIRAGRVERLTELLVALDGPLRTVAATFMDRKPSAGGAS
jgi:tRNA-splicing ligase RtcB